MSRLPWFRTAPDWEEGLKSFTDEELRAELERRRLVNCETGLRQAGVPQEFWRYPE